MPSLLSFLPSSELSFCASILAFLWFLSRFVVLGGWKSGIPFCFVLYFDLLSRFRCLSFFETGGCRFLLWKFVLLPVVSCSKFAKQGLSRVVVVKSGLDPTSSVLVL